MLSRHRSCRAMIAASFVLAALAGACRAAPESPEFNRQLTVVVMDPLAAPLSCPCVEGYAQRRYEVLGEYLSRRLKQPVAVVFSETIAGALAKEQVDAVDLVIGKDSVVRAEGKRLKLKPALLARLTGKDGKTTQHGLVVVRSADAAREIADLAGYRILFGPADCDEKFAAARKLLAAAGVKTLPADKCETSEACSDGATKIIECSTGDFATQAKIYSGVLVDAYQAANAQVEVTNMRAAVERQNPDGTIDVLVAVRTKLSNSEQEPQEQGYRLRVRMALDDGTYKVARMDQVSQ